MSKRRGAPPPDPLDRIAKIVREAPAVPPPSPPPSPPDGPDPEPDFSDVPAIARLEPAVTWPYGFDMEDDGLVFRAKSDSAPEWLSGPFKVHATVRTEESHGWSTAISFRNEDRRLQVVTIARADLVAGDASEVRRTLAGQGLMLSTGRNAKERFIAALAGVRVPLRALLVDRAGWHVSGRVFVSPHRTITSEDHEPIVFPPGRAHTHFRESGSLDEWRGQVASLAAGQSRLLFALGVAFAGPLLEPLGYEGGAFNLVGPSSCGKTTALRLAGSVWGGGGPLGAAVSWRTTANALEGVAAAHNDTFLALDELGLCEPRELDAAAYALTGGSGKGRMKADGELRARTRWRIMALSTGEVTIDQRIAEGMFGRRARAGQAVRFVDLDASAGRNLGVFDHAEPFGDPSRLANALGERAGRFFGTAGPAFVEEILANREQCIAAARKIASDFVTAMVPPDASGQVFRVAQRFGLVAAGGELATILGIVPVPEGSVRAAAERLFSEWLARRGGVGSSEARDAVTAVRAFLQQHALARFVNQSLGYEDGSWRAQKVAGFKAEEGDFLFNDEGWREATDGLDPRAAADALWEAGFLLKDSAGKRKKVHRIGGKGMRVYHVKSDILVGEDT